MSVGKEISMSELEEKYGKMKFNAKDTKGTMSELQKVASEIELRSGMSLVRKKHNEMKQGVNELKEQYQDVYTTQALNDIVQEYKSNEYDKHVQYFDNYDKQSERLLSEANMLADKLESNLQSAADPTTQYELEQHNYLVDKLKNNLFTAFTGNNPDLQEINSVLKQAENDKGYARAITHLHAMLINNIESNMNIEQTTKQQLRSTINGKMEELKHNLLPFEYKRLQSIKADIENSSTAVKGQRHHYDMLNDMYEGKDMQIYKMPKGSLT